MKSDKLGSGLNAFNGLNGKVNTYQPETPKRGLNGKATLLKNLAFPQKMNKTNQLQPKADCR
jgi:hypothetical protein